jgi:two-component system chemotaxis response regulator CheV
MSGVIDGIDKRTRLAGNNRLEILMFYLANDNLRYGINVFKVQEVIKCPPIRTIPDAKPEITGIVDIRGVTLPVIDLAMAINKTTSQMEEPGYLVVCEYNKRIQGFRVSGVDRIVNMNWEEIMPPPKGLGDDCYMTAVTQVDDEFVEIIDVEKVMSELSVIPTNVSNETIDIAKSVDAQNKFVLIVDDSVVARKQMTNPLDELNIEHVECANGKEALDYLLELAGNDSARLSRLALVISDVEMPCMDGYTLVTNMRKSDVLKDIHVILHSSLSGGFNKALVEKVGADRFIAKYDADILTQAVIDIL